MDPSELNSNLGGMPDALRLRSLQCTNNGAIQWDIVLELASLELLFEIHVKDDIVWDCLKAEFEKKDVDMPTIFLPQELCPLSKRYISRCHQNIGAARDDLMEELGGFFVPKQDDPIFEWLRDVKGYSNGRRVEAENFTLNTGNRQMQLSICASFMLRHIFFSYNLPCNVVPAL